MKYRVLTISREYGSGGAQIAGIVGSDLHLYEGRTNVGKGTVLGVARTPPTGQGDRKTDLRGAAAAFHNCVGEVLMCRPNLVEYGGNRPGIYPPQ